VSHRDSRRGRRCRRRRRRRRWAARRSSVAARLCCRLLCCLRLRLRRLGGFGRLGGRCRRLTWLRLWWLGSAHGGLRAAAAPAPRVQPRRREVQRRHGVGRRAREWRALNDARWPLGVAAQVAAQRRRRPPRTLARNNRVSASASTRANADTRTRQVESKRVLKPRWQRRETPPSQPLTPRW
jgi:hypothetical protein